MTPVLMGRWQTRIFVSLTVGLIWTIVITPFLLINPPGADGYELALSSDVPLGDTYKLTLAALLITTVFGCLFWDVVNHGLMQFRWEKDWPAFFNLLQVFPECLTTFLLLHVSVLNPLPDIGPNKEQFVPVLAYLFLFFTTWVLVWLAGNGPMKIFFVRWRFFGGRII